MSRIYEMCNDIDSKELLKDREELTREEKGRLTEFMKRERILCENGKEKSRKKIVGTAGTGEPIAGTNGADAAGTGEKTVGADGAETGEALREEGKLEGSIQTINESIEEMTDRLIARFEEQVEQGEGHGSIYADHEVVTDTIIEDFEAIKEDQNFYLNEEGQIVICFDEYEVAPGYMGLVEFAVDEEAVADIRK